MLSAISDLIAILLTGIVVKFMDDLLDEDDLSQQFLYKTLGEASYLYSLVFLLIACMLNLKLTTVLFLACYGLGMLDSLLMPLPTGIPSWLEMVLAVVVAWTFAGACLTIWSYFIIGSIQLLDDLVDQKIDQQVNQKNIALSIGTEKASLLFLIIFYLSLIFQPILSVMVFTSALLISHRIARR